MVKYEYDAWGNHTVKDNNGRVITSGIGVLNPFRYRGYYYDTETELYYLQTRYYDPEIGRFISQDSIEYADPETINGLNLYAYCGNNPVMNVDPNGTSVIAFILILVAATAIGATVNGVKAYQNGVRGSELFAEIVKGAAIGLAIGAAAIALVGVVGGAVLGASATILGVSAKTIFVIGAVAFNFDAFVLAPILGFEMEGIDFETPKPVDLPTKPQPTPSHPGMKPRGKLGLSISFLLNNKFKYYNINQGKINDYIQWRNIKQVQKLFAKM
ncbi:MAG: RHS repeat-associated core domain-containing protein [Clostridia bacterium]|nr:RHS repeat-associated core domain-containing protein [Clostridia bacterium]